MSEELAWAAGLYDGEGSCGCYGRHDGRARKASYWHVRVNIGQHYDPEVLDRFVRAVGVGKVYGPYWGKAGKERYVFQVVGENALTVLERLWPWMSAPKRKQAEAAIAKFNLRPEKGGHSRKCLPGCTCKRHHWLYEEGLSESDLHHRERQREYQRRHRLKKSLASEAT